MTSVRVALPPLDVHFNLETGVTAIVPGARKMLLLGAIAGFVRPTACRILLNDRLLFDAAARVHLPPQRRGVGFVPQRDSLVPDTTPRQNLMLTAKRWPRLD